MTLAGYQRRRSGRTRVESSPSSLPGGRSGSISEHQSELKGQLAKVISYPRARDLLHARIDASPLEIAMWVNIPEGLNPFRVDGSTMRTAAALMLDIDDIDGFLFRIWFDESQIQTFAPLERYCSWEQIVAQFSQRLGEDDAKRVLAQAIREFQLCFEHPLSGEYDPDSRVAKRGSLGCCVCRKGDAERVLAMYVDEEPTSDGLYDSVPSVPSNAIIEAFKVFPDARKNSDWWDQRLRDPGKFRLLTARVAKGTRGGSRKSMWNPAHVAAWLIHNKKMERDRTVTALRRAFPELEDLADLL